MNSYEVVSCKTNTTQKIVCWEQVDPEISIEELAD